MHCPWLRRARAPRGGVGAADGVGGSASEEYAPHVAAGFVEEAAESMLVSPLTSVEVVAREQEVRPARRRRPERARGLSLCGRCTLFTKRIIDPPLFRALILHLREPSEPKAFLHFAECLDNRDLTEIERDLRELTVPLLIVRGDADRYLGAAISEKLHREIPGSRLVRIAIGGHFIQEDEPDRIARELVAFFRREHAVAG